MPVILLLLLQDQHEVEAEAGLHHHPVHRPGEVDVRGEEHDVLPLQGGDGLVLMHQVGHHGIQGALPLTGRAGAGAGVRPELAELLVVCFFRVGQSDLTPGRGVFTREKYRIGHFLHRQVANGSQGAPAGWTTRELWATVATDKMAALTLKNGWQHIVKADRTLKETGQVIVGRGGAREGGHPLGRCALGGPGG